MNVFFGKMNNEEQCRQYICSGQEDYFGGMQPNDYVFIRLQGENATISRLWQLREITQDTTNNSCIAHFTPIFNFTAISLDEFSRLPFFKVGKVLGNKIWKQTKTGFFKIELDDADNFSNSIQSASIFEEFVNDKNHLRKIVLSENVNDPHSDKDIQIVKRDESYEILNSDKSFLSELNQNFNPTRYAEYVQVLQQNNVTPERIRGKVKKWLDSNGNNNTQITIENLWDFFCSKQKIKSNINNDEIENSNVAQHNTEDNNNNITNYKNLIIYGIPGCGKSYRLKNVYLTHFDKDKIIRTTFHPEYSNTDFVGQVRPYKNGANLEYKTIPGPFTKALFLAYKFPNNKVALVIEEINRGNAATIFGDLFQLLDRDDNGNSEYEITNEIITSFLKENNIKKDTITIPSNLYLYATMNTSDQNVFKLDTAFKRRWEFERLTNKDTIESINDFTVFKINDVSITWKTFINEINEVISNNEEISGDRQIGNFFYDERNNNLCRFANKVLEYLYNDVCKYAGKEEIFNTIQYKTFDDIYYAFINGDNVFNNLLFRELLQ